MASPHYRGVVGLGSALCESTMRKERGDSCAGDASDVTTSPSCPGGRGAWAQTPPRLFKHQTSEDSYSGAGGHQIGVMHHAFNRESSFNHVDHCAACGFKLAEDAEEVVIRAMEKLWHRECFTCGVCYQPLLGEEEGGVPWPGEEGGRVVEFYQVEGLPLCETHFLETVDRDEDSEEQGAWGLQKQGSLDSYGTPPSSAWSNASSPRSSTDANSSFSSAICPDADAASEPSMAAMSPPRDMRQPKQRYWRADSVGLAALETQAQRGNRVHQQGQEEAEEKGRKKKKPTSVFDLNDLLLDEEDEATPSSSLSSSPLPPAPAMVQESKSEQLKHSDPPSSLQPPPLQEPRRPLKKERPPLTNGSALSYGIHVAAQMLSSPHQGSTTASDNSRYRARRHMQLMYGGAVFYWEESAPEVFEDLRTRLFGVSKRQYQLSMADLIGGKKGEGKSGSVFYRSHDDRLTVKTVTEAEHSFLLRNLQSYTDLMASRGCSSLLPRFYGLYNVKLPSVPACRLVVMNNVFQSPPSLQIVQKYDLKGSLLKRCVPDKDVAEKHVSVLKDLNFCNRHDGTDDDGHKVAGVLGACRCLRLGSRRRAELLESLRQDVEWLRAHNIMDYSLLVGIARVREKEEEDASTVSARASKKKVASPCGEEDFKKHRTYCVWSSFDDQRRKEAGQERSSVGQEPATLVDEEGGIRPIGQHDHDSGDAANSRIAPPRPSPSSHHRTTAFCLGIVDILQEYGLRKKMETLYKTGLYSFIEGKDPRGLSVVDPGSYATRFIDFIEQHTL